MLRRVAPRLCKAVPVGAAPAAATAAPAAPRTVQAGVPATPDEAPLSEAAQQRIAAAKHIGDEAFEENTRVLQNLAMRGLRAVVVIVFGIITFNIALKRKKRRDAEFEANASAADPTQRYLEEMGSLGFDVEKGEQDAAQVSKRTVTTK